MPIKYSVLGAVKSRPRRAEVLAGAADILAERISEDAEVRAIARKLAWKEGRLSSTATHFSRKPSRQMSLHEAHLKYVADDTSKTRS